MKLLDLIRAYRVSRRATRGFTLIEILVTLVIVSVAVLSLGNFTISMVSSGQVSRERLAAVHMAEQVLEFWQNDPNSDNAPTIATADCSLSASTSAPAYPVSVTCTPASGASSFTIVSDQVQATGPLASNLSTFQNFTSQGYIHTPQTKVVTVSWVNKGKTHSIYLTHMSQVK